MQLELLGWTPLHDDAWRRRATTDRLPARVVAEDRGALRLAGEAGELDAVAAGRLERADDGPPTVGDWVVARPGSAGEPALVEEVLPRRTAIRRRGAGRAARPQTLAANVDVVCLVMGLDADFNLRRLERFLVLAWDSGALPLVLLNKVDLCAAPDERLAEAAASAPGVAVHLLSARTGEGLQALEAHLAPGRTLVLLGSSGAGKSTLANRLLGEERLAVGAVRERDERGQHTTTRRQLVQLAGGALLLDTPGLREVATWQGEDALPQAFSDLAEIAAGCHFRDCTHSGEPGCAVTEAVAAGLLDASRVASHAALAAEARALAARRETAGRQEAKRRGKQLSRAIRQLYKLRDE